MEPYEMNEMEQPELPLQAPGLFPEGQTPMGPIPSGAGTAISIHGGFQQAFQASMNSPCGGRIQHQEAHQYLWTSNIGAALTGST